MAGGFKLQKWASNHNTILNGISPSPEIATTRDLPTEARTLGLTWRPLNDTFNFHVGQPVSPSTPTKRSTLSRIAQIFDPLGWLGPVTIVGKIFIQRLWRTQIDWDDPLPPLLAHEWSQFDDHLKEVSDISIPRWVNTFSSTRFEFHGFSDASQDALGAVLYLRTLHDHAEAKVALLAAKSKVAPVKRQTIPRLELIAALLLARLLARIQTVLEYRHVPAHLWTDSSVSLAWIRGHPSQWKEFVSNRVATIQELIPEAQWHYVAGVDNPADCLSRGLSPSQLQCHISGGMDRHGFRIRP